MTSLARIQPLDPGRRGLFWAWVPVILLGSSLLGVGWMATIATRDPGFALEQNYYEHAVHWERQQAQNAVNQRLGYQLGLSIAEARGEAELSVRPIDRSGAPLVGPSVTVEAFANARSGARRTLVFAPAPDGTLRARLGAARPGLWEFRFDVHAGDEHYTEVVRRDLHSGALP